MMEENPMLSGASGYSESSDKSMGNPPSFTLKMSNSAQNNQNDSRATERAEVLKKHKYTIKEELGRGISGRAFLVKSPDEDYFVAKEINYRDNVKFNLDAAKTKNEINILKNLHHGYIVGYEDSFEESGYFYIVSEYCAGGDLYKKMKMKTQENTRFEEEQFLQRMDNPSTPLTHVARPGRVRMPRHRETKKLVSLTGLFRFVWLCSIFIRTIFSTEI